MAKIGQVWHHANFYKDRTTGEMVAKYLLVLGFAPSGDVIYKLLTSRVNHRQTQPSCSHDDVRPGYYVGIPQPTGQLFKETWIDLRESEDYDLYDFRQNVRNNALNLVFEFTRKDLCSLLACAANAPDTMRSQREGIMNSRAELDCG